MPLGFFLSEKKTLIFMCVFPNGSIGIFFLAPFARLGFLQGIKGEQMNLAIKECLIVERDYPRSCQTISPLKP